MSKIGRKLIDITGVQIDVKGNEIHYKGPKNAGVYVLPSTLKAVIEGNGLTILPSKKDRKINSAWGLHRALLYNKIRGAVTEFEKDVEIVGLGFKAAKAGTNLTFSLGYSHKIDFELPTKVTVDIDRTGQKLAFKSSDKELLGLVCSKIRALRAPEPYKGTGIKLKSEVLLRKAGKAKASAG
jgi:large subunit ribosomal protein L6